MMIINQFVLCHCINWRIFVDICKKAEERDEGMDGGNLNGPSLDQRGINTAHNLLVTLIYCNQQQNIITNTFITGKNLKHAKMENNKLFAQCNVTDEFCVWYERLFVVNGE